MLTHALALAVGLYLAWYVWPMPPVWLTKVKDQILSWTQK